MSETLTFVVPMPPNIANGSHGHWRTRHNAKLAYWETLDMAQGRTLIAGKVAYMIPYPPKRPWGKATIRAVMHLGGAMDDGNAMRRLKWTEDWLVTRGYLADDRKQVLTWAGFPEQVVKRDGNYRIEITLERGDAQEAA